MLRDVLHRLLGRKPATNPPPDLTGAVREVERRRPDLAREEREARETLARLRSEAAVYNLRGKTEPDR